MGNDGVNKKVSFIKKSTSALGKLILVILLSATFVVGMVGVVYLSLQGEEIKVPEIVGKDVHEIEKELEQMGLRVKKRAERYSEEKPNTILEQLPRPGDTVKSGQMILVVTSKANPEGAEKPATIKKNTTTEQEDREKIEELISDKPKKSNKSTTNSNKKKTSTRDVLSNNSNSNSNTSNSNSANSNKSNATDKPSNSTDTKKPGDSTKPDTKKTPAGGGDIRPRKTP